MKILIALAFSLALAGGASAAPAKYPHVVDGSFTGQDGSRVLEQSTEIEAPAAVLFYAYVNPAEFARWNAPKSWNELRVGGTLEASYQATAKQGDAANIKHRIVTFLPNRLIVFQNIQTPPGFPHPEVFQKTYIVLRYLPLSQTRTRVSIALTGFGDTPADKQIEGFFRDGNAQLLEKMKAVYDGAKTTAPALPTGERLLVQSIDIKGTAACAWKAYTDEATLKASGIPFVRVELKNGGVLEEGFSPQPKPGETIRHRIITCLPERLIVLRNETTPPGLPGAALYPKVVQVVSVEPQPDSRVRLTIAHTGYGSGGDWDGLYGFFKEHNPEFLTATKAACEKAAH